MSIASMIARAGQSATHERPVYAEGQSGARTIASWTALASSVAVWVQPASVRVIERFKALSTAVSHIVYTEADLAARPGDRLTIGPARYLVRGELDQAGLGRLYALAVEEVR